MNLSRRVTQARPYLFHEIDKKREQAESKGIDVISLGIGDPDRPTPDFVVDLMQEEIRDPRNHTYPSYQGEPDFRRAVAEWFIDNDGRLAKQERSRPLLEAARPALLKVRGVGPERNRCDSMACATALTMDSS